MRRLISLNSDDLLARLILTDFLPCVLNTGERTQDWHHLMRQEMHMATPHGARHPVVMRGDERLERPDLLAEGGEALGDRTWTAGDYHRLDAVLRRHLIVWHVGVRLQHMDEAAVAGQPADVLEIPFEA